MTSEVFPGRPSYTDAMAQFEPEKVAFGEYPPPGWLRPGLALARGLGENSLIVRAFLKPLRALTRRYRTPIDTECLGLRVRLHHYESLHQSWLLFYPRRVDGRAVAFVTGDLGCGDNFLDAGAHIGFYALVAARCVGPKGRVIAVEADERNFTHLNTNVALNSATQITAVHAALADSVGEVHLNPNDTNRGSITVSSAGTTCVRATPLWPLMQSLGVTELAAAKVDIEGYEERVLSRFFDEAPRTAYPRRLLVEVADQFGPTGPLLALLDRVGYRTRFIEYQNHAMELT
jgi:FkbM family methyltransferase